MECVPLARLLATSPRSLLCLKTVSHPPSCPAGAQWQKASEVFEQMLTQGCNPDVVT